MKGTASTRLEAAQLGQRRYNTGRPCGSGHTADRYTSTGQCVECEQQRAKVRGARHRQKIQRLLAGGGE